jgi:two-component system, NtrC family, response regulator HupR/HoxA
VTTPDYGGTCVLVVDDNDDVLELASLNFAADFRLLTAASGAEALLIIEREPVVVLVTDQRMPDVTGLELIRAARARRPDLTPILLTGYTDQAVMAEAINVGGIRRFIPKPFVVEELREAIRQAIEAHHFASHYHRLHAENARLVEELRVANERLASENRYLQERAIDGAGFGSIIGTSPVIQRAVEQARRVLDTDATVLLEGPTGSGKELFARALHHEGRRREKLFVAVNCGTMNDELLASTLFGHRKGAFTGAVSEQTGLFELAHGGTLFLDEIGETSPAMQVHLLRVLQEGEIMPLGARRPVYVDVRVIAATNRDLREAVQRGSFRIDLLHRLRVFPIEIPSLAMRRGDIPALAEHLLARLNMKLKKPVTSFTPQAVEALERYEYEGNVRELANLIERALILCPAGEAISEDDLFERMPVAPTGGASGSVLRDAVSHFEQKLIRDTIAACGGNKTRAAQRLGISYRGLTMKMQRYGMAGAGERAAG